MIVGAEQAVALDRLDEALRLAPALGPELFSKIIDGERHAWVRPTPDRMICCDNCA
jgi:hypothetical protein